MCLELDSRISQIWQIKRCSDVMGGANDISKHEANTGLKDLRKFVNSRQNTNIMAVTALHGHDLQETSCVNREIEVFNRKLHKDKVVTTADRQA